MLKNGKGGVSVNFLPDGKTVAYSGPDGKERVIIFWNALTGKQIRRVEGYPIVTFTPDGKVVAARAGITEKTIRLLELDSKKEIASVTGTDSYRFGTGTCFSADGRSLAVAGGTGYNREDDPPLRIFEVATGKETCQLPLRVMLNTLIFAPDGKTLATVTNMRREKPIQVWDVATRKELRSFLGPDVHQVSVLAFSPDSAYLAMGGSAPSLILWDPATGKERWQIRTLEDWVCSLAFSPNGRMLGVGTGNKGVVCLVEAATGGVRCHFNGLKGAAWSVAFSPDGLMLVSATNDTAPLVWDVTGRILAADKKVAPLAEKDIDALWSDVGGADAAKAWQGMLALIARPEQAESLLKEWLHAKPGQYPKRLAALLADLDSNDFKARENASKEIGEMGPAAVPALRKLAESGPSPEVKKRVAALLDQLSNAEVPNDALRATRALEVLEYIATPAAKELLEAEAKGAADSDRTRAAKAALEWLKRQENARKAAAHPEK